MGIWTFPFFKPKRADILLSVSFINLFIKVKMENIEKDLYTNTVFAALGDPLIKGLTEVANVKPKDPVAFLASFLHNFPEHEKPQVGTPQVRTAPTSSCIVLIKLNGTDYFIKT